MYCKKCGKKLDDGDRFCSSCGTPVPVQESDSLFKGGRDGAGHREESAHQRKPFHMDELKWDLEGFPDEDTSKTDDVDFNWSSVLEERDRHMYRGFDERPSSVEEKSIFDEFEETRSPDSASFDWSLGSTMRIERPSDVVRRKKEEAEKAEAILPEETDKAEEDAAADEAQESVPAEEEETLDLEKLAEAPVVGSSHKIDKFYTFNKKNEEFQALLDQEYERLRQRIREESEAEASFQEKYDKLQKARDDWSRQEIRSAVAGEKRSSGAGVAAGAAIGGVMAAVDKLKNRPSKADDEVDGLDDYVITDLFTRDNKENKDEAAKDEHSEEPSEEKEAAEKEISTEETAGEEISGEYEAGSEEVNDEASDTTDTAASEEKSGPECEDEAGEDKTVDPEEADKEEKSAEEQKSASCPPSEGEHDENAADIPAAAEGAGDADEDAPLPEKSAGETGEPEEESGKADEDRNENESKVADITVFDDGDEPDEDDSRGQKKGKALNIVIAVLAVIVVINLACVGILTFAGDSKAAGYINDGYSRIIGLFSGDSEEPADEPSPAPEEPELTGTAALIEAEKDKAANIGSVEADSNLLIPSGLESEIAGLDGAEPFVDMAWYTDDEGNTVNYGNAVVGKVMDYYSDLAYSKSSETDSESVTYSMMALRIGEIRQNENNFFVVVQTDEGYSDSSDVTTGEYVVHLVAEDKTLSVSEVTDVMEEN